MPTRTQRALDAQKGPALGTCSEWVQPPGLAGIGEGHYCGKKAVEDVDGCCYCKQHAAMYRRVYEADRVEKIQIEQRGQEMTQRKMLRNYLRGQLTLTVEQGKALEEMTLHQLLLVRAVRR